MVQPNLFIIQANQALASILPRYSIAEGTPINDAVSEFRMQLANWTQWWLTYGYPNDEMRLLDSGAMGPFTAIDPDAPPACLMERLQRDLANWGNFEESAPYMAHSILSQFVLEPGRFNGCEQHCGYYPRTLHLSIGAVPFTTITGELAAVYLIYGINSFGTQPLAEQQ